MLMLTSHVTDDEVVLPLSEQTRALTHRGMSNCHAMPLRRKQNAERMEKPNTK